MSSSVAAATVATAHSTSNVVIVLVKVSVHVIAEYCIFFGYKAHRFLLESPYFCQKLSLNLGCVLEMNIFRYQILRISIFQYNYAINRNIVGRWLFCNILL